MALLIADLDSSVQKDVFSFFDMARSRCCLICCYMGPLPRYFPLWLRTCEYNPEVSFLLIGSHLPQTTSAENVTFISMDIRELKERISDTLNINSSLSSRRKICDFRPSFGHVFKDCIEGYDFWGYCDMDIIWGDLGPITKDQVLDRHDIISVRGDRFVSGPCTLFRNTKTLRRLYRRSPSWKDVFTDPNYYLFDEDCGRMGEYCVSFEKLVDRGLPVSMLDVTMRAVEEGSLSFYTPSLPRVLREEGRSTFRGEWSEGTLLENGEEEVLGFHLLWVKKDPFFRIPMWEDPPSCFKINSRGIFDSSTNMAAFEAARLGTGAVDWIRKTARRKVYNLCNRIEA